MQAVETIHPAVKEEKIDYSAKPIDLSELGPGQRYTLKEGLSDAIRSDKKFNALGNQHKQVFYDTCFMIMKPESLAMLNIKGEDYWKSVDVPPKGQAGKTKKEKVRFYKFTFEFVIPGTDSRLTAVKEWRYEDFQ